MNEPNTKPLATSKTMWVNLIIVLAGFWSPAREWVTNNPEATLAILGGINAILRFVSGSRIVLY